MPASLSASGIVVRAEIALLVVALLGSACNGSGSRNGPTAPPAPQPPPAPTVAHVEGSMIDPRNDTGIGGATFSFTRPDGSAGQFAGATFSFDIRPDTTVAVSAPDYEGRMIGPTPDSNAGSYFMRYTGDARFNDRFQRVALALTSSTQRMSGTCLRGESPTPLELQVDGLGKYGSMIRAALPDLTLLTRGAYDLANAPFGKVLNWDPEIGVLKVVFAPQFYTQPCYPAPACTRLIGNSPQILGASIIIAADRAGSGSYLRNRLAQQLAEVAGARGTSSNGGVMTVLLTNYIDKYDTWTFNTLYCLPIGYTPGSLTAASSAALPLPFRLDPRGPGQLDDSDAVRARSSGPDTKTAVERRAPFE